MQARSETAVKSADKAEPPPLMGRGFGPRPMGKVEKAKDIRGTIRRLWDYLKQEKKALVFTSTMVIAGVGLNLIGPFLLTKAIDDYILKRDVAGLGALCLWMLIVYLLSSILTYAQSWIMTAAAQRTIRKLRIELFERMQSLPLKFFDQRTQGELMSRLTNDVENINAVLSESVSQIVSGVLNMVGTAVAMFLLNPRLATVSLTTIVTMTLLVNFLATRGVREAFRRQQAAIGFLNGFIEETVSGQRVVKAYHREDAVLKQFDAANLELRTAATKAQIVSGVIGPLMNLIGNASLAIVASIGGGMAVAGLATVGTLAGFINYSRQFGRPLNEIANLYNSIQSAVAGAERVFEIMDESPEADYAAGDVSSKSRFSTEVQGDVIFDQVAFSYDKKTPVLNSVSLHARPGQTIALIGPTGAGKTTIINLLTRFYEIDSGIIRIDGRDIREFPLATLRSLLGIVLQDTYLFNGTVGDNIRYGKLNATNEEVVSAAKLANADMFIHRLPHGYETVLSERGGNLSQGQRQMIAIARAILADPKILILDEATSNVDTRTEKHIQEAMRRLMSGRTSFVIAHRLSTIREADQILAINAGEIVEQGAHNELLTAKGFYYRLFTGQFDAF